LIAINKVGEVNSSVKTDQLKWKLLERIRQLLSSLSMAFSALLFRSSRKIKIIQRAFIKLQSLLS